MSLNGLNDQEGIVGQVGAGLTYNSATREITASVLPSSITTLQSQVSSNDTDITTINAALLTKQNTITADDLTISMTSGLQTALDGKQPTIADAGLTIAKTSGLQTALDGKQATIADAGLTIAKTSGLQTALDDKVSSQWTTSGNDINYNTGKVGIGTSTYLGTHIFDTNGGIQIRGIPTNTAIGHECIRFARRDNTAIRHSSLYASCYHVAFNIHNSAAGDATGGDYGDGDGVDINSEIEVLRLTADGNNPRVGIGDTSPDYPLSVGSGVLNNPTSAFGYLVEGDATTQGSAGQYTTVFGTSEARQISIRAARNILTEGAFVSTCDRRIKTNIQDVDDNECLRILRNIKPKKYKYINQLEKGYSTVYGYIAQDVKEHLPYSVVESVGFIPNMYQMASFVNDEIEINTSLLDASSSCLKLMNEYADHCFAEYEIIHANAIKVVNLSNHQLDISTETTVAELMTKFFNQDKEGNSRDNTKLFVYGNKVSDFHSLAKEDINVIAVGAIQKLDSQIDSLTKRIEALERYCV